MWEPRKPGTPENDQEVTMFTVIVYTRPRCVQCDATKRALDRAEIDYQVIDVSNDSAALTTLLTLGFQQVPVVVAGEERWSGFRPELISHLRVHA